MDIKNEILWRIYVVMFFVVVFGLLVFGRVVQIQVVEGEKWRAVADSLYLDFRPVKADRGNILTEDGSLLATSLPYFKVSMDTKADGLTDELFENNVDTLAKCLSEHVDQTSSPEEFVALLRRARSNNVRYLQLKRNVSYQEIELIKSFPLFELGPYKGGIIVERENKRQRPFRMLAHRTIGYVRPTGKPVGLEGAFDEVLKGEEGIQLMERISGGVWIPVNDLSKIEPEDGHDIVSTIDVNLQDIAGNALLNGLKKHDAHHGCAVVMDVKTGAIRAIANIGKNKSGSYWETYNYAVGESTEPGSTIKLATIMALLEDGFIDLDDTISLEMGKTAFYEETMVDASYHGLDSTTVQRAFEISSNVGLAKMVHEYYNVPKKGDLFINRLKQMRLNEKVGIEIEGEGRPFIKEAYEDNWSGTTLPWMAHGYELELTPLQLLTFYNAVANDGRMMKPYLVSELRDYGNSYEKYTPIVLKKRIASESTIKKAKILLEAVVENGTAKNIKSNQYLIAGKTGTAQINYRRSGPQSLKYQSSFVGYYPADNPIYSCIVVINDPKQNGFYGSEVAAPIFKEIADKTFSRKLELHRAINVVDDARWVESSLPDYNIGKKEEIKKVLDYFRMPYDDEDVTTEWTYMKVEEDKLSLMPRRPTEVGVVPNVVGMGIRDAMYIMEEAGLKVSVKGVGKVVEQSIPARSRVSKGKRIVLRLK